MKTFLSLALVLVTLGAAAQRVEVPGGVNSNTVYSIALGAAYTVGGATGGVTIATANLLAATNSAWQRTNGASSFLGTVNTTNFTQWLDSSFRAPYWSAQAFGGHGYHYYLNLPGIGPFIRVRSNTVPARALYIGAVDEGGNTVLDAVSTQVPGNGLGNTNARITFVINGPHRDAADVEIAVDPSWQFHADAFGADYIDHNTFDHVSLWMLRHDFTNNFYLGVTNYQTTIQGTNVVIATNATVSGTLKPAGGTIGDRTITAFSMSHNTLYTNGIYRATFHATIGLDPSGADASAKIVTYKQNNTGTNFWADISVDDPGSTFLVPRYGVTCPLNPGDVFYILSGGAGGPPAITNAKIVAE